MLNESFFEELKEIIKPYFEIHGSHSFDHTWRVYNNALRISEGEEVDLDIVKASALLHDVARKMQDESEKIGCHAEEGAKLAEKILKEKGFPEEKIESVAYSIKVHRYSLGIVPDTNEAKLLQDADRLDALGAITIGRVFDYAAKKNRPMHDPSLILNEYVHNSESASSINHFYEKILKIKPENFYMKNAKELAEERYNFVKAFVERFIDEWNGKK
jgi:uncharacterized protein